MEKSSVVTRSYLLVAHPCGTASTGGVTVTGAGQSGASLTVTGVKGQTINVGDAFSVAAVYAVNSLSRRRSPIGLQRFLYTGGAPFVLTGGADVIAIAPAIYGPAGSSIYGQYQNVDALPANGAAFTFFFENPEAVERAECAVDPEKGASIAYLRSWD